MQGIHYFVVSSDYDGPITEDMFVAEQDVGAAFSRFQVGIQVHMLDSFERQMGFGSDVPLEDRAALFVSAALGAQADDLTSLYPLLPEYMSVIGVGNHSTYGYGYGSSGSSLEVSDEYLEGDALADCLGNIRTVVARVREEYGNKRIVLGKVTRTGGRSFGSFDNKTAYLVCAEVKTKETPPDSKRSGTLGQRTGKMQEKRPISLDLVA